MQRELGKAPPDSSSNSGWLDVLSTLVPTGVIAGYSAVLAPLLEAIQKPTAEAPTPDQLLVWRIPLWILFIGISVFLGLRAYNPPQGQKRRPLPMEVVTSAAAFAFWGLAGPGTWLPDVLAVDNPGLRPVLPLGVAVIAALVLGGLSGRMVTKLNPG